ncbi:D-amino-acid oxidase [Pelagivirga sediminicola]|uniref:D-amino-acid oxidase n=1 Tax=Pelagivirga sediminicola TaxID=2170575 RepID=A0A2T7G7I6_9RHOB|nr:FAD-binding oxidoreductase [Pelagivirga sediminicola]PVA10346.1 D-amino-acid oxidase [Pelagivirga sediminicola]
MPGPRPVPVRGDADLPGAVDVVIIGGGIIGCATALELAEAGQRVAICEKGGIAQEQSSRNWGWVRISRRDPREVPLMAASMRLWRDLDKRIGRETGYVQSGICFICEDEATFANYDRWKDHLVPYQMQARMLRPAELQQLFPGATIRGVGALHTPEDGRAEPQTATPAIAEAARDKGAHILTECAVRSVETQGGRVCGVVTERGRIGCSAVVVAGGAWSNLFLGNMGLDLPALGVVNHVLRTGPVEGGPEQAIWTSGYAFRKRADGGYTIAQGSGNTVEIVPDSFRYARRFLPALRMDYRELHFRLSGRFLHEARRARSWGPDDVTPFERERVLDPAPSPRMLKALMSNVSAEHPAFRAATVAQEWAGCIDVTPDAIPVISAVGSVPGLHIASGFSGHGFGIGPGAGGLMADIVLGRSPRVDPHEFRFSRFTDGSRIAPQTGY